jgi:DNA-binding IclR family transcriptional regulator
LASEKDHIRVLRFVDENPRASLTDIAKALNTYKGKAERMVNTLFKDGLVKRVLSKLTLTAAGGRELNARDLTASTPSQVPFGTAPFPPGLKAKSQ